MSDENDYYGQGREAGRQEILDQFTADQPGWYRVSRGEVEYVGPDKPSLDRLAAGTWTVIEFDADLA